MVFWVTGIHLNGCGLRWILTKCNPGVRVNFLGRLGLAAWVPLGKLERCCASQGVKNAIPVAISSMMERGHIHLSCGLGSIAGEESVHCEPIRSKFITGLKGNDMPESRLLVRCLMSNIP